MFSSGEEKTVASKLGPLTSRSYSIPFVLGWVHRACILQSLVRTHLWVWVLSLGSVREMQKKSGSPKGCIPYSLSFPILWFNLLPPAARQVSQNSSTNTEQSLDTWFQPSLWQFGGIISQTKHMILIRAAEGLLPLEYIRTKDWMLSLYIRLLWSLGHEQVSGYAAQKAGDMHWPMFAGIFWNPFEGSLLWGRCWRLGIEDLVCDIFRKERVLGLKCLYHTSENGTASLGVW